MKQKLFALSLGFGGLILATDHAFGAVVEVFASDRSGTWTITATLPTGDSYEALTDAAPIPGSPA